MARELVIRLELSGGESLHLGARGRRACRSLHDLSVMIDSRCVSAPLDSCGSILFDGELRSEYTGLPRRGGVARTGMSSDGRFAVLTDVAYLPYQSGEWPMMLRLGMLSGLSRGQSIFPVHGALLETGGGHGVLLFGRSGIGKTTTVSRYRAAGGVCRSDDFNLCQWDGRNLIVYPMPTCSYYCVNWTPQLRYSYSPGVVIDGLWWLQRGDRESVVRAPEHEWLAALAHAISFHWIWVFRSLPAKPKREFGERVLDLALTLKAAFAPESLLASLDGDIMDVFRR